MKSNSGEKLNSQICKLFKLMAKKKTKTIYMHNVSFALRTSDYSTVKLYRDTDCSKKILKVHWCRFESLTLCSCSCKTISWKFHILNPIYSELFTREVYTFLKSRLLFNIFYCFCMFVVNKRFMTMVAHNAKSEWYYNAKSWAYYFYVNTKISLDFQICISVPSRKYS